MSRHVLLPLALLLCLAGLLSLTGTVAAEEAESSECKPVLKEVGTALATANFFSNVGRRPGSLAFESNSLLEKAKALASSTTSPCPEACQVKGEASILFSTTPNKFLSDYSDFAHCKALLEKTKKEAIRYADLSFSSTSEFYDWYQELTSGDGKEGEDLYSRCDKSCSPQYSSSLVLEPSGKLLATTSIICGHARDKSDNSYRLRAQLRWQCVKS